MNKIVVVTGGTGFLGARLIQRLLSEGYIVRALARSLGQNSQIKHDNLFWIDTDLSVSKLDRKIFDGVSTVFHLAGYWRGTDKNLFTQSNEMATINLLESMPENIDRFVYTSTQMVYGNPNRLNVKENDRVDCRYSDYSYSKLCTENWIKFFQSQKNRRFFILRLTGFIEGGGLIDYIISRALNNQTIELHDNGSIFRDYISLKNGIDAIMAAELVDCNLGLHLFNIGSGSTLSTYDLAKFICVQLNSSSVIQKVSTPSLRANFIFDIAKAREELGYMPDDLIDSIKKYINERVITHKNG